MTHPSCTPHLVQIGGVLFTDHKSLNRIELSQFVMAFLQIFPALSRSKWVGGVCWHVGVPHAHAHTHACMHMHNAKNYMLRNCQYFRGVRCTPKPQLLLVRAFISCNMKTNAKWFFTHFKIYISNLKTLTDILDWNNVLPVTKLICSSAIMS